jgi:hypothetical protein
MTGEQRAVVFTVLGVCVALTGALLSFYQFAWLRLALSPMYCAVVASHIVIHVWIANRAAPPDRRTICIIIASHVGLLAAVLLQYDVINPPGWIVIDELVGHHPITPAWLRGREGVGYDFALFVPVLLSYLLLWCLRPRLPAGPSNQAAYRATPADNS